VATPPNPLAFLGMDVPPEALMAARAAALRKQAAQRPATAEEAGALGAIGPGAALSPSVALAEALRSRTPNTGAYELFSGDDEGAVRARAEGINLGLGRQRAAGNLGLLTGDRVLGGFGRAQLEGADKQEGLLAEAGQFRAGNTLKQALAAEEAKRQARIDSERERHNRVMEGRPPSNVFLQGPGGQYFMGSTRGNAPLVPVENPTTGDPLLSPKADDLAAAAAKLAEEKAAKERAHEEKVGQLQVGGFTFAPERLPSTDAAKQMKDVAIQRAKIQRGVSRLKDLYAQHGTELFGGKAGEMESEFTSITTALRMMNEMGVPNGRDYEFLAKELADPTTWKDLLTSKDRNLTKLDTLSRRVNDTVSDTAEVLGYAAIPSSAPASTAKTPSNTLSSTSPRRAPMPEGELTDPPQAQGATTRGQSGASGGTTPSGRRIIKPPAVIPPPETDPLRRNAIRGQGTEASPYIIAVAGQKPGYIQSFLSDGEVAFVRDLDGGRVVEKVNGKIRYADGKPPPRFKKAEGK
jgi:hypothetical protein